MAGLNVCAGLPEFLLLAYTAISYDKCAKISNTSCLPKRFSQTGQPQIRLLLKKQSDLGLHCLLFWEAFCVFQP